MFVWAAYCHNNWQRRVEQSKIHVKRFSSAAQSSKLKSRAERIQHFELIWRPWIYSKNLECSKSGVQTCYISITSWVAMSLLDLHNFALRISFLKIQVQDFLKYILTITNASVCISISHKYFNHCSTHSHES